MRLALLVLVSGCVDTASQFTCAPGDNAACGSDGRCEASGNCSLFDPSCGALGFRYDRSAASGRAGVCVLALSGATMTVGQPIDALHPVDFEFSTQGLSQPLVLDTETGDTDTPNTLHLFPGGCPPMMQELETSQRCMMTQAASRLTLLLMSPGVFCLRATADASTSGHIGVRIFPPGTSAPSCVQ